jgi:predicted enzyme related to lactoylglutathione lyase
MMEIRAREPVIHAEDFSTLVAWYRDALGFAVVSLVEDGYHYCNLSTPSGFRVGIAAAAEMGVTPGDRAHNTIVLQFEVDDLREFFVQLEAKGATITGGPSFDEAGGFWFGSFADPEGNPVWVVDKDCP